jgi:hypothetical protein
VPLFDEIKTYSVSAFHNDILDHDRQIRLQLKSGGTALIGFPPSIHDQRLLDLAVPDRPGDG